MGRKVRAVGKEGNWISYSRQRESWEALEQNMDVSDLHCSKSQGRARFLKQDKKKITKEIYKSSTETKILLSKNKPKKDLKSEATNKHKASQ